MNKFNHNIKVEIAKIIPDGQDEALSELSAIIKTSGEISKNGKEYKLVVKTELLEVCDLVAKLTKTIYGEDVVVSTLKDKVFSKLQYHISFPKNVTMQLLKDTEIIFYDDQHFIQISQQISPYLIAEPNLAKSYLRGVFLGCFSSNISLTGNNFNGRSTGYHAEFVFSQLEYAQSFSLFLADFDIISKLICRKDFFVVYVKDLEMISDLLALCGANQGVLALQNESAMRSIRNMVNRQTNCISANLTKTVDASIKQMEAIDIIRDTIGLDALDDSLRSACYLRIANPEESLDNLAKLSIPALTKSALYRRLKKIEKIALEIKK